jgi:hypothetical protein
MNVTVEMLLKMMEEQSQLLSQLTEVVSMLADRVERLDARTDPHGLD